MKGILEGLHKLVGTLKILRSMRTGDLVDRLGRDLGRVHRREIPVIRRLRKTAVRNWDAAAPCASR